MNKVMVKVYVPLIEREFDIYIPINKKIGIIKKIIINTINEITELNLQEKRPVKLYDKITGSSFDNESYVKDSSIRNGTQLILL